MWLASQCVAPFTQAAKSSIWLVLFFVPNIAHREVIK
jgi:hypothetical protein